MKKLVLKVGGKVLYSSRFDPKSGALVRAVATLEDDDYLREEIRSIFPNRYDGVASPVPETLDVKLTGVCGFGCPYCVPPGSTIKMGDGSEKSIEEIQLGDLVETRDGPKEVTEIYHTPFDGELFEIEMESDDGICRKLRVTGNHPIFTTNRGFVEASDITLMDDLYVNGKDM